MKKSLKRKIHDVSTYVIKHSKRPFRECAILVICTILLIVSSLSTGYESPELTSVDTIGVQYHAPAEFCVSEIIEEKKEDVLNESRASSKETTKTSSNFETLGSFEAYETIQLLKTVQILSQKTEDEKDRASYRLPKKTEAVEKAEDEEKEEQQETLSVESFETIDVAMAETSEVVDMTEPVIATNDFQQVENVAVPDNAFLAKTEEMPEDTEIIVGPEDDDNLPQVEEIDIQSVDFPSDDCADDGTQVGTCGLSASEYDALCRIVEAEAGTEGEEGKLLVANVVLNRVANPAFPSTIEGVITADGQFSPVQNGRYQRAVVTPETLAAVNRALNGENISKGALYFKSVHSTANWRNRTLLYNYKNHNFYQ